MKIAVLSFALILCGCGHPKPDSSQKHYTLTGTVTSVNLKEHVANIDGAAIPGFMGAMSMDYPVPAASDLTAVSVGEKISAIVNVNEDGSYTLSDIHELRASGK